MLGKQVLEALEDSTIEELLELQDYLEHEYQSHSCSKISVDTKRIVLHILRKFINEYIENNCTEIAIL